MDAQVFLTVSYDGAGLSGFQAQPGQPTVQGRLEEALSTALRRPIRIVGAGRTDAGAHALGQVVSFPATGDEPQAAELLRSVNALAGPGISVRELRLARPDADARHSAVRREYLYRICSCSVPPVFTRDRCWWVKSALDADVMREASRALLGEHDFASFCVTETGREKPTVRTLDEIGIEPVIEMGEGLLGFRLSARSFLHSMVRIIVGSLVEVGKGARPAEWLSEVLEARERAAAGPTAPSRGLTLMRVGYPDDIWV